jgi:hypothetical protein
MDKSAMLPDVHELEERGRSREIDLGANPLVGATVADLLQRAAGAGGQDGLVQVMSGYGPIYAVRSLDEASVRDLLNMYDPRQAASLPAYLGHIYHLTDIATTMADENPDPGLAIQPPIPFL